VGEGEMITGVAPLFNPSGGKDVIGVVTATHFIRRAGRQDARNLTGLVEYNQLKVLKNPIKSSYKMAC